MLDIVIVNWNSGSCLKDCVLSINACGKKSLGKLIIVDNSSTDRSLEEIPPVKTPYKIIRNEKNAGFAAACNQGAKLCSSEFILFLNPDTRIGKTALEKPVAFMRKKENSKIGILGVQLVGGSGEVLRTCARFPAPGQYFAKALGLEFLFPRLFKGHFMREWDHQGPGRRVDQVMGAYFLVRRDLFGRLDGFDGRFFVFYEEVDFSLRALKEGFSSYYFTGAKAFHEGGGSNKADKSRALFYSLRSRILYGFKHFGFPQAAALLLLTLLVEPFSRLVNSVFFDRGKPAADLFKAYFFLLAGMPSILQTAVKGPRK